MQCKPNICLLSGISDCMVPTISLDNLFDKKKDPKETPKQEIIRFTEGFKTRTRSEAGIYGQSPRM